jgi:hypothetical protein
MPMKCHFSPLASQVYFGDWGDVRISGGVEEHVRRVSKVR